MSSWSPIIFEEGVPLQDNNHDCGVFLLTAIDYLTRNAKLSFSQADIPSLRRVFVLAIMRAQLVLEEGGQFHAVWSVYRCRCLAVSLSLSHCLAASLSLSLPLSLCL